jgi:sugar phosphate isomerase/epimerase
MVGERRVSICEFTTLTASFAEDLAAYSAAGAAGIGICEFKLGEGDEERLSESGLIPALCVPAVPSILPLPQMEGPGDPAERIDALCSSIERFGRLGATAVMFLTGPGLERRDVVVEGVRRLADAASRAGATLALEPIHPQQRETFSFVNTLDDAKELLDDAGANEVRLLFDSWNLGQTPGIEEQIERYAGDFASVHLADRREPSRSDYDRVFPGDGVLPLGSMVEALEGAGYDGWYEVEIFSDDGSFGESLSDSIWALPADEAARRAVASVERLWDAAA